MTSQAERYMIEHTKKRGTPPNSDVIAQVFLIPIEEAKKWREAFILKYTKKPVEPAPPIHVPVETEKPVEERNVVKDRVHWVVENWTKIFLIHTYLNKETVKWCFGFIAAFLAYRDYTYYHVFFSKFDTQNAWISSVIGVAVLLMLPVVVSELFKTRKYWIMSVMLLVYIVVLACTGYITYQSIMTMKQDTVAVVNKGNIEDIKGNNKIQALKDRKTALTNQNAELDSKIKQANAKDPRLDESIDPESKLYRGMIEAFNRDQLVVRKASNTKDSNLYEISGIDAELMKLNETVDTTVVQVKADTSGDVIVVALWAAFLDVIGPVSVYVSFFL